MSSGSKYPAGERGSLEIVCQALFQLHLSTWGGMEKLGILFNHRLDVQELQVQE